MGERLHLVDAIRGFSLLSMVAFHLCYDIRFIAGAPLPWFAPPLQDIWRASISWTFLFVAGAMCALSRNNLRRAAKYGVVALLIFLATSIVSVDDPINFGIIFCMAGCTATEWACEQVGIRPYGIVPACVFALLFMLTLGVPRGVLGFAGASIDIPRVMYSHGGFAWLGFPGPGFSSSDYYPLIPHVFLFLAGSSVGWWWKDRGFPAFLSSIRCRPLEFVGRHTLPIYVAHQPVLLAILGLLW